jgi:7,8-dihydroneopterin aldolase/epimerase/oxygenase
VDRITLTGIEVFAHHGVLPEERQLGQRFVVDVTVEAVLSAAAASDDLADTIDYGNLAARIAAAADDPPCHLIETGAARVADTCLDDSRIAAVEVTVHKPAAPLPVHAQEVAVHLRRARS